ncbi:hypothetical protein [Sessilibacter corallicola]|uniref:Uncharacterized protein n=1 Tax=Sessilibacter corallicola TaxID=2904075 RepID=A0ABQ0A8J5_9GAMM
MMNPSAVEKANLVKLKLMSLDSFKKANLGFQKEEYIEPTDLLGEGFKFWFSGMHSIEVSVKFNPISNGNDNFTLFIYSRKIGSDFCLDDWLKIHGEENVIDAFRLLSYSGSFSDRLDAFFIYLESIFSMPELMNILSGTEWEDVPFDWAGMK